MFITYIIIVLKFNTIFSIFEIAMIFSKNFFFKLYKIQLYFLIIKKMRLNFRYISLHMKNIKFLKCMFYCRNLLKFD